ncbi:MAG: hypothetical protein PVS3B3_38850 [Ktedonobacteraceae bacterium]
MSTAVARLFSLKWNNSKMKINPVERHKPRACVGVHFANGFIALENGACFSSMGELEHHLGLAGTYELTYEDWEKEGDSERKGSKTAAS